VILWLRLHGQALAEALRRLASQAVATLTSGVVLGMVIALPILAGIALRSLGEATARMDTDPHVHVFLALDASDADVKRVEAALRGSTEAAQVRFVSRDAAFAELKATTHLAEMLASLDRNPLPHAFSVRMRTVDGERILEAKRAWAGLPKVDEVVADLEWARRLGGWVRLGERLVLGFGLLLALAVVLVVSHLVRLQVLARRPEIELSRLIGATPADVRRPFLYFGMLQGLLAGVVGIAASTGVALWVASQVQALTPSYAADLKVIFFGPPGLAAIVAATALVGLLAADFGVARELKTAGTDR
jgi:cell division transport system permease protein